MPSYLHALPADFESFFWRQACLPRWIINHTHENLTGAHDNGYTSTLNHLQSEGLLGKVVLLRGYKDIAVELKSFVLPHLEIPGLFMTTKLPSISHAHWRSLSQHEHGEISSQITWGTFSSPNTPSDQGKVPIPLKQASHFDPSKVSFSRCETLLLLINPGIRQSLSANVSSC
jgi:hypothetical protein